METAVTESINVSNILLIGLSGSGKSTTGCHLAKLIGFGFFDLDRRIEDVSRKSIKDLFVEHGESHFRELESTTLRQLGRVRQHVIALGAGTLMNSDNLKLAKELGFLVWLNPPTEDISRRLYMKASELETRPLLSATQTIENKMDRFLAVQSKLQGLMQERIAGYQHADLEFGVGYSSPETVAWFLKQELTQYLGHGIERRFGASV
jgi:shikimate kinase